MSSLEGRNTEKTTLKDVANLADVSPTTVSLLLHGHHNVCTPQTALRIRNAIEQLGYVGPSGKAARSVKNNADKRLRRVTDYAPGAVPAASSPLRLRKIGVSLPPPHGMNIGVRGGGGDDFQPNIFNTFADQITSGMQKAADREDYCLLTYPSSGSEIVRNHILFADASIDGIIAAVGPADPLPVPTAKAEVPLILLGRSLDIPLCYGAVYAKEEDTVQTALSHLWDLGHRRIAHIAGPVGDEGSDNRQEDISGIASARLNQFTQWMKQRSAYDPHLVSFSGSWLPLISATKALAAWRALPSPPTAVFCSNDVLALGILKAALSQGLRVPSELSIVGVDSVVTRERDLPLLTSVAIPGEQIGQNAVYLLQKMIEGFPIQERHIALPVTELFPGETAGPCPSA